MVIPLDSRLGILIFNLLFFTIFDLFFQSPLTLFFNLLITDRDLNTHQMLRDESGQFSITCLAFKSKHGTGVGSGIYFRLLLLLLSQF